MRLPCTIVFINILLITNITIGQDNSSDIRPKPVQMADQIYKEAIEVAKTEYDKSISQAHVDYLEQLEKAITQETKAGRLDAVLAIRDIRNAANKNGPPVIANLSKKTSIQGEIKQADSARINDSSDVQPKYVQAAVQKYAKTIEDAKKKYDKVVSQAHSLYLAALEKVISQETKTGQLNTALLIRDIRNAAKESGPPVIQTALTKQITPVSGDGNETSAAKFDWTRLSKSSARVQSVTSEPIILKESMDKDGWQRVPDLFKRHHTVVYMEKDSYNGVADFEVIKDGTIYLACDFGYQGNNSGNWTETRWTKEQFIKNGWTEVPQDQLGGVLVDSHGGDHHVVFMKQVKRGEKYRLRCNKYRPPRVIVF